jgi:hypothetical protein
LAVVTLATLTGQGEGFTAPQLMSETRDSLGRLGSERTVLEFESRLAAVGYQDELNGGVEFRLDGIQYFNVRDDFPRIRRSELLDGVVEAGYDISLTACMPYISRLGGR